MMFSVTSGDLDGTTVPITDRFCRKQYSESELESQSSFVRGFISSCCSHNYVLENGLCHAFIDDRKIWLVVTGCTNGIGKSYAKQLAAKGLNIVLMSRSKEKLERTASEIEKDYNVKTKIIQVDFCGGHEIYEPIGKELEDLEIGVLVNNVATSLPYPALFHELSSEVIWSQINGNILSAVMLTRLLIPEMVQRKKGLIINVSSFTSAAPYSLTGTYAASKACIAKFSESLEIEYSDKGIIIQCVIPLWVSTNMSLLEPSLFVPHPDDYVRGALQKVGVTLACCGYWSHEVQGFIIRSIPRNQAIKLGRDAMLQLRERSLRHLDEKKEK